MSPGVLASMWKEEEIRTKLLEEKMTALLKEKGVKIHHVQFLTCKLSFSEFILMFGVCKP